MSDISNCDQNNSIYGLSNTELCPLAELGCTKDQKAATIEKHFTTEEHQKRLVILAQNIIENKTSNSNHDSNTNGTTENLYKTHENISKNVERLETLKDQLLHLSSTILQTQNLLKSFPTEIDDTKQNNEIQRNEINVMGINEQVLESEANILKQQVEYRNQLAKSHILDGSMIWRIENVLEKMYDAQSERQTSIYSPVFFTSESGYKLCVRLYLNGDGSARGTHVSIFLIILRGPYDALLQWPFSYRVSFCLYDQQTIMESGELKQAKHIIESFRPDTKSLSFQRPSLSMNIASGIPKFISLDEFNVPAPLNRYVINDTMFIKVLIDFIGVPRSMSAFIFSLNCALPKEIQRKLVDEEIKRRAEQVAS
ncbi:unnamed protein product [Rotaria socialis]|uniref:MATH domain-containing protein n=1 Tax=Rotaria socialis TaxID=392032 RepID=A0A818A4M4_9BILA|nr:unnamed protein product [Rotaria socialis]CAF3404860.1 unnamed protein product [Rotaria socialis]CAF3433833.1 unnamed protein product [Rotaria socialis]CAF3638773.1 unnamed protein product [Rotaria socialis]CAF3768219.1 unnamed protein product [Rotaria socialis]